MMFEHGFMFQCFFIRAGTANVGDDQASRFLSCDTKKWRRVLQSILQILSAGENYEL
jgi:hypothetical protein